jgi:ABC-type antimicrobial peptide transport system permease subunit
VYQGDWYIMIAVTAGLVLLVGVLVTLAASGIYAIVSYSVSERTREIGIRTALGASRRTLILTILRRSLVQIGVGAVLGLPLAATILWNLRESESGAAPVVGVLLALVLAVGIAGLVGLFSCVVPTRRVLRVEASVALRGDG